MLVLSAFVAMIMASSSVLISWRIFIIALIGVSLLACAANLVNQLLLLHCKTKNNGQTIPRGAIILVACLGICSTALLFFLVNPIVALLSLVTLCAYLIMLRIFSNHRSPYDIMITGLLSALFPLFGWTAVTGRLDASSLSLVAIIFVWGPPHIWSLAIYRYKEYKKANIPILPITHGIDYAKTGILMYTLLLIAVAYLPFVMGMTGLIYLIGVTLLNGGFLYQAIQLYKKEQQKQALHTFRYSIFYLLALFLLLLIDHYVPLLT